MLKLFDRKGYMVTEVVFLTHDLISYVGGNDILFDYVAWTKNATIKNTDWYSGICDRYNDYPIINLTSRSLPNA